MRKPPCTASRDSSRETPLNTPESPELPITVHSAADLVAALHRAPVRQLSDHIEEFLCTGGPVTRAMFAALGHRGLKSAGAAEPFPGRALFDGFYRAAPEPLRMAALVCILRVLEQAPITDV